MRRYTSERIDSLLDKMDSELPILKAIKRQKALEALWESIPDKTLRQVDISATIDGSDNSITLVCQSVTVLNYVKRQIKVIETHLAEYMQTWGLSDLKVMIK